MITITPKARRVSAPSMKVEYSPHWLRAGDSSRMDSKSDKEPKTSIDLEVAIQELKSTPEHIE